MSELLPRTGVEAQSIRAILRIDGPHGSDSVTCFGVLSSQAGYTLIETLVAMTLLVIVIGAIADGFASASKTQTDQTARADDQEAARLALDRLRRDIHCSSAAIVTARTSGDPTQGLHAEPDRQSRASAWPSPQARAVAHREAAAESSGARCRSAARRTATRCTERSSARAMPPTLSSRSTTSLSRTSGTSSAAAAQQLAPRDRRRSTSAVNRDILTRPDRTYDLTDQIALRNDTAKSGAQPGCC